MTYTPRGWSDYDEVGAPDLNRIESGIASVEYDLGQETARATAAETTETTRATAAETTNAAAISTNATAISTETTRATAAEFLAAKKSANLSDLASTSTARTNLGLGNVDNTSDASKAFFFVVPPATGVAATDLANINAQIALANAVGGVVQLRSGSYVINGTLTALANGVEIRGAGPIATVLYQQSLTADYITSTGTANVGVRDLQLDALVTRTAGSGITFTNVNGYILDNLRLIDTYNLGTFTTAHSGWISRIKVAYGGRGLNRGLWWQSCIDTHLSQVLVNGGTKVLGAGNAWLQVDSGCDTWAGVDIDLGASSGSGVCLYLSHSLSPSSFAPRWVKLTNWWAEGSSATAGSGSDGIKIDDTQSAYFTNGQVSSSLNGVNITGGRDISFSQCIFQNNWLRGAVVGGAAGPTDIHFRDCNFESNSQGSTNTVGHVYFGGGTNGARIRDSRFSNRGLGLTNKVNYAIENYLTLASDTQVSGCVFTPTDYGTGILGGTYPTGMRLRDNYGYNPIGILTTPTMPATTVAYTNNFGVDCTVYITGGTVSAVAVAGAAVGTTSGAFRVAAGVTIAITYTAAPAWIWVGE